MEKTGGELRAALHIFDLPTAEEIRSKLEAMDKVTPAARNRFFPMVEGLAGAETTGEDLVVTLVDAVYRFAKTKGPTFAFSFNMMLEDLPRYLSVLVADSSILEDTTRLLQESVPEIIEATRSQESDLVAEQNDRPEVLDLSVSDLPHNILKMLKTPPNRRSEVVKQRLDAFQAGLGELAMRELFGPKPKSRRSLSQSELAARQARQNQNRNYS